MLHRIRALFRRRQIDADLQEELQSHLDEITQALIDDGVAPDRARRQARLRLGGATQIREVSREAWTFGWIEGALQDLRLAARALRRRPMFTAAAAATLALGIGASTAIFSVAYGVSLRPLPYPNPDRLLRIYEANPASHKLKEDVSDGAFQAWREATASTIESMTLFTKAGTPLVLRIGGERVKVAAQSVTPGFFDTLGVRLMLGPGFKPEHEYTRFTTKEVVLSYDAWQRLCGGRADAIGTTVTAVGGNDDDDYRIVGVMPKGFAFIPAVDMWRPQIIELPVSRLLHNWRYDRVVARMKPGVSIEKARAEIEAAAAGLAQRMPTSNAGWTVTVESLHSSVVGDFGKATWLLLAAVGVVLLVACLNVGGLLMARAVGRDRETAVRMALGASAWRLVRLWLAEATVICTIGGGLGVLLAALGVSALKSAAPPGIPRLDDIALDWPTLAGAAVATFIAVVVFTIAPLVRTPRHNPVQGLRTGSAGAGTSRLQIRTRVALTIAQCAGAAALVVLALMLTRSFLRLTAVELGWNSHGVLSVTAAPAFPREVRRPWYLRVLWSDDVIQRLENTPGIIRAAVTTQVPLGPTPYPDTLARGRSSKYGDQTRLPGVVHKVTDHYFDLMGIRLISGRLFGAADRFGETAINETSKVDHGIAVVSMTTARTLWPGQDPIGQSIRMPDSESVPWRDVVGVVDDIQFSGIGEPPAMHVFVPFTQSSAGALNVLVRTSGAPDAIAPVVRNILLAVNGQTDIARVASLDSLVARATVQPRFTSRLVVAFGALALALAAVGIYGTLSYLVGAGLREIGIRVALGASRRRILSAVVWRGLAPALAGSAIGLGLALTLGHTFRALLFGIEPIDAASLAGGAVALVIVALVAALGPAVRAARVDPVHALRAD